LTYGSIYGEGIYSADLYSWEAGWDGLACAPTTREPAYVAPPPLVWPGTVCAPVTRQIGYQRPPPDNWGAIVCAPVTRQL
jgi:hypothetical protein